MGPSFVNHPKKRLVGGRNQKHVVGNFEIRLKIVRRNVGVFFTAVVDRRLTVDVHSFQFAKSLFQQFRVKIFPIQDGNWQSAGRDAEL
jgi:hypothetical protein